MKDSRILVTGGAGFIGSNLVKELHKDNDVLVLDNLSTGNLHNIGKLDPKPGLALESITDYSLVNRYMKDIDYVFHLAAMPSVPISFKQPVYSHETNVNGTLNVLDAARKANVKKVIFASSAAVYGNGPEQPKTESMVPYPESPYAMHKLMGEQYCKFYTESFGLPTTAVRFFNVYGPNQNPTSVYAAVITKFISLLNHEEPITIHGDGEQTRDFTHVDDAVRGMIACAQSTNTDGKVLNIATGNSIPLNELVSILSYLLSIEPVINHEPEREGDVKYSSASIHLADELLDFRPNYDIRYGLASLINPE